MVKSNRLINIVMLLGVLGVFLAGCSGLTPTPTPAQMDTSPFTGIPCAAPCWQGLNIGESNEQDVLSTLSSLTFIDQTTILTYRGSHPTIDLGTFSDGLLINASCIQPSEQCLSITIVDDILTEITLHFNYEINIEEAIEYLGDPDYIGAMNLGAEEIWCDIYLVWREKQLVLVSGLYKGLKAVEDHCGVVWDTGKVDPGFFITGVRYLSIPHLDSQYPVSSVEFFEYSGMLVEGE